MDERTRAVFAQILADVIPGTQGHMYLGCSFGGLAKSFSSASIETPHAPANDSMHHQTARFPQYGDMMSGAPFLLLIIIDKIRKGLGILAPGKSKANASLVPHAGRLLALDEVDVPYHVRITCNGVVETL